MRTDGLSAFDTATLKALAALGFEATPRWNVRDRNTWIVETYGGKRLSPDAIASKCGLTTRQVRSIAHDQGVTRQAFRPRNVKAHAAARDWLACPEHERPSMRAIGESHGVSEGAVAGAIYRIRNTPSSSGRGKLSPHDTVQETEAGYPNSAAASPGADAR